MRKQLFLCASLFVLFLVGPAASQTTQSINVVAADTEESTAAALPSSAQLSEIAAWVSKTLGLPEVLELPRVQFVTPARMAAVRFRGLISDRDPIAAEAGRAAPPEIGQDVYAIYDDRTRTIYLHKQWSSERPADVSVLVHEMVHHMQNVRAQKFGCPQEREKDAYEAQRMWLAQYKRTLEDEFEIDAMTVLIRTNCGF
jgi:hypothetical protein